MGKYVRRITYKGKGILFLDGRGLQEEEYIASWDEMEQELLKDRNGSLVLMDATGAAMTTATVNRARQAADAAKAKGIPNSASAFVGLSRLQKVTAQLAIAPLHLNVCFCNTLEEGKEWLVNEDEKRCKTDDKQHRRL